MVRDDVEAICREARALSAAHDIVLTAGGLGPTLDDVTMQAGPGAAGRRRGGAVVVASAQPC